ncbi:uncharacterized protein [Argopecten irradians]|uniref:uncharacterized protein n=1 Tax=Argopecten irradians TaxID=31199 RepID=UPI0037131D91
MPAIMMTTTQSFLLFFYMTCVCAVLPTDISRFITYDCLPDGEVHIHGVPKGYSITSLYGGSSCHVTQIDTNDYSLGHYCTQRVYHNYPYYTYLYQADVQLSHSSSNVVGGSGFSPFRLICDKVHSGGQMFTVFNMVTVRESRVYGSSIIPTLPYRKKSENNRRYASSPRLTISRSQYSSQHIYGGIQTGNLVYLHIRSGDSHFSVRPENCSAEDHDAFHSYWQSYLPKGQSVDLWDITQDRCVLEPYLMEKFRSLNTDQTEVAAPVYAFHFSDPNRYYKGEVNFKCTVRVCGRRSFSCTLSVCDDVRREGRSAEEEDDDDCDRHEVSAKITISSSASASVREYSSFVTILSGFFSLMFTLVM